MSDGKRQVIIPPGFASVPARVQSSTPSLPALPAGNSVWPFEVGRYERNTRAVAASANYMRARTDQADACLALIKKRKELLLEIASLSDVPELVAHHRELGRLDRLSELRIRHLQHELAQTNAKIEVAAANVRLAQMLPIPETPAPAPQPVPAPTGLSPADIRKAAQMMPEFDGKPETIETLVLLLSGVMAEKNK